MALTSSSSSVAPLILATGGPLPRKLVPAACGRFSITTSWNVSRRCECALMAASLAANLIILPCRLSPTFFPFLSFFSLIRFKTHLPAINAALFHPRGSLSSSDDDSFSSPVCALATPNGANFLSWSCSSCASILSAKRRARGPCRMV